MMAELKRQSGVFWDDPDPETADETADETATDEDAYDEDNHLIHDDDDVAPYESEGEAGGAKWNRDRERVNSLYDTMPEINIQGEGVGTTDFEANGSGGGDGLLPRRR